MIKKKLKPLIKKLKLNFCYFNQISFFKKQYKKEIIIIFDGKFQHGGLVDRLKGIVSFYQIAKKTNADFKIFFNNPFELSWFLEPNSYDWTTTKSDLKWNPFDTKMLYFMDDFDSNPLQIISESNKKKFIVFANIDYSKTINPTLDTLQLNENWKKDFNELFKKSDYLDSKLNALNLKNNRIAIHTRFTNVLGDFKDTTKNEVSNSRKNQICNDLKIEISEIENQNTDKKIYVFSDSIRFLNYIKKSTNYIVIEGIPQHIDFDKNRKTETDNHLKTFIDFFALAYSKKIYLLKTKEMYNSAFSKYAAIVGGNEFIN
jgi:hypothetical protein